MTTGTPPQDPRSPIDLNTMARQGVVSGDVSIQTQAEQNHRLAEEALKSKHTRRIEIAALAVVVGLGVWLGYLYTKDNTPVEHQKMALQAIIGVGTALLGYVAGKKAG